MFCPCACCSFRTLIQKILDEFSLIFGGMGRATGKKLILMAIRITMRLRELFTGIFTTGRQGNVTTFADNPQKIDEELLRKLF